MLELWKYALVNPEQNIHLPSTPIADWLWPIQGTQEIDRFSS